MNRWRLERYDTGRLRANLDLSGTVGKRLCAGADGNQQRER